MGSRKTRPSACVQYTYDESTARPPRPVIPFRNVEVDGDPPNARAIDPPPKPGLATPIQ